MTELAKALRDLDEKKVHELVAKRIAEGASYADIIKECTEGFIAVGELFESKEYYLTELMFSAEIMKGVMDKLEPLAGSAAGMEPVGTVVIGTVKGDIHDIGKNIVVSFLRGNGFEVVDLGVDVPAEKFVKAVKETGTKILGLSALLNTTYPEMKNVVEALKEEGLRDQVKVIIGGAICSEKVRQFTGADYYATDVVTGVKICKSIYE